MTTQNNKWGEGKCSSCVMLSSPSWPGRAGHQIGSFTLNRIPLLFPRWADTKWGWALRSWSPSYIQSDFPREHLHVFGSTYCEPACFMLWENQWACSPLHSYLEIACACLFLTVSSPRRCRQALGPLLPEQEWCVVMPCGDFAMWRNWHGDKIALVLFSDLKECKLADLTYLQTLADALTHTTL